LHDCFQISLTGGGNNSPSQFGAHTISFKS
jgi:hypothetical protein